MQTERALQEYLKRTAKKHRVSFFKMECVGRSGFPDVMLAYAGRCVFIELKSPAGTGRVSPRQKLMIEELTNQGMTVYVSDSKEEIDTIIAGLINH